MAKEMTTKAMVQALYDKFIKSPASTPFGVPGAPSGGQIAAITPPSPLTDEFLAAHWYSPLLSGWVPAGPAHLTPSNLMGSQIPPIDLPAGWQWNVNPETGMCAARRVC